jgi:hypothetical protein
MAGKGRFLLGNFIKKFLWKSEVKEVVRGTEL